MNNLQARITKVEAQIADCERTMNTILSAANVAIPEELTGLSAQAWSAEFKASRKLHGYLMSIHSILDSAEKFIFAELS